MKPEPGLRETGYVSPSPSVEAEWWTTSDVAAYLGVAVADVTNYRKRGQMPALDGTVGRTHMWRPGRIVEWPQERPRPDVGDVGGVLTGEMRQPLPRVRSSWRQSAVAGPSG